MRKNYLGEFLMRSLIIMLMLFGTTAANAASVIVDFNGVPAGYPVATLDSDGFRFTAGTEDFAVGENFGPAATTALAISGVDSTMDLLVNGTFSLDTFKMRTFTGEDEDIVVTGYFQSGGLITRNLTITSSYAPTYEFAAAWQGLVSIQFDTSGGSPVYVDNIVTDVVASVVPVPAAVWLFGSALAGLGWLRRKQTA
jgi:hypothetical protein